VEPPAVAPRRFGLLDVVSPATSDSPHWRVGVTWDGSAACGFSASTTDDACLSGDDVDPLGLADLCSGSSEARPITVYTRLRRSLIDDDRTQAVFDASEGPVVEAALWAALDADATALGNADTALAALAFVEQYLASGYGGIGVIHVSPLGATMLKGALVRDGDSLTTLLGTPVIVGAGYDHDGGSGGACQIIGSGAVLLYRGETTSIDTPDREVNDATTLVQRTWVVGWDCLAVSVGFEVTTPVEP
jgi:hypothetical protein